MAPRIISGSRTFGRGVFNATDLAAAAKVMGVGDPAITGSLAAVQHHLTVAASRGVPLTEVAADARADSTVDAAVSHSLLLQAASRAGDTSGEELAKVYEDLAEVLQRCPGLITLGVKDLSLANEAPSSLFHVAIDLPAVGGSEGDRLTSAIGARRLFTEVIQSLGKSHAFAIVADGTCATWLLDSLVEQPSLTSFVVLREPTHYEPRYGTVLHPTLVVASEGASKDTKGGSAIAKKLSQSLTNASLIHYDPATESEYSFMEARLAGEVVSLLSNNGWRGYMPGFGHNGKLPLLTKLAGGRKAWESSVVGKTAEGLPEYSYTETAKEDASKKASPALQPSESTVQKFSLPAPPPPPSAASAAASAEPAASPAR